MSLEKHIGVSLNPRDFIACISVEPFDIVRIAEEAWEALMMHNDPPTIFLYGAGVVRLKQNEDDNRLAPESMTKDRLKHHLNRSAKWRGKKGKIIHAPDEIAADMLANPETPLPKLKRIVNHPVFLRDLTLLSTPGYSKHGQIYLDLKDGLIIPRIANDPSPEDLQTAIAIIEDIFAEFPFTANSGKAHAIAMLLLPFVIDLIDGPTPLHFIEAPSPGTGKTLLAFAVGTAVTGRPMAPKTESRQEDEWRRTITGVLRGAPEFYLIDNVRERLDSAALASALTTNVWEDRIIQESRTIVLPVRNVWIGTGNNPSFSSEITRRVVPIRLDAEAQRPWGEGKKTYKYDPLLPWIKDSRSVIIWAVLTIIQNWIAQGCPYPKNLPALGSYEEYRRVIGGILQAAGIQGFLGNLQGFYHSSDEEIQTLKTFVHHWWETYQDKEVGASELYQLIKDKSIPLGLGKNQSERSEKTVLGKILSGQRDRRIGKYRIRQEGTKQGAQQYRLILVENEPTNEVH